MKKPTHIFAIIGIFGSAFVFAACGASSKNGSSSSSAVNTFVLSEFTVVPPTNALRPGRVTITANNVGGEVHELVFVRADSVSALPMKPDGSVDEAKVAQADKVGEIEDVAAQSSKTTTLDLTAGTYIALCNIVDDMTSSSSSTTDENSGMDHGSDMEPGAGHVHFAEGMQVAFTVS